MFLIISLCCSLTISYLAVECVDIAAIQDFEFFVKLKSIRKCFTVKGRYFVLEEYNPKTRMVVQRKYESSLAGQICYSVLCVFSYTAAIHHHKRKSQSTSENPLDFKPPPKSSVMS